MGRTHRIEGRRRPTDLEAHYQPVTAAAGRSGGGGAADGNSGTGGGGGSAAPDGTAWGDDGDSDAPVLKAAAEVNAPADPLSRRCGPRGSHKPHASAWERGREVSPWPEGFDPGNCEAGASVLPAWRRRRGGVKRVWG